MGRFINGVLVGLGISLLMAPRPGKELRQMLAQSWREMNSLPAPPQPNQQSAQKPTQPRKPLTQEGEKPIPSAQEVDRRAAAKGKTVPETSQ